MLRTTAIKTIKKQIQTWRQGAYEITRENHKSSSQIHPKGISVEIIPSENKSETWKNMSNVLHSYWYQNKRTVFEVWSQKGQTSFYSWAPDKQTLNQLTSNMNAVYPDMVFDYNVPESIPISIGDYVCGAEIQTVTEKLARTRSIQSFEYDPLTHVLEAMHHHNSIIQMQIKPIHKISVTEEELKLKKEHYGPEIELKLQDLCFNVNIRIISFAETIEESVSAIKLIANSFSIYNGKHNQLKPKQYKTPIFRGSKHILKEILTKKTRITLKTQKQDILLSIPELAALYHIPTNISIVRYRQKPKLPLPTTKSINRNGPKLGYLNFRGQQIDPVSLSRKDLLTHQYVVGATGTGKSTLLLNEIRQITKNGTCCWVIDPHGDLATDVIETNNNENIIFLDPIRVRFSINPFELPPYADLYERQMIIERIIGQMVELMKRLFGEQYWGPSLNRTFQNIIRILYERDDCPTFEDILDILVGRYDKLEDFAETQVFKDFKYELEKIPRERMDAVINKVDPFVKNALLRMLFCNKRSTVDFDELIKPGKLVVWRLSKAELTELNMNMIGSAIITKLWFHGAARHKDTRNPVVLVLDEFQNFAHLETLEVILAEARKYGIGLVLSHQQTKQLPRKLLGEVLGNTGSKIVFRVSGGDASLLAKNLDYSRVSILRSILTSLPDGAAVVKLKSGFGEDPIPPFMINALPPPSKHIVNYTELIAKMVELYGVKKPLPVGENKEIRISPKTLDLLNAVNTLDGDHIEATQGNLFKSLSEGKVIGKASELPKMVDIAQSQGLVDRIVLKSGRGRPKIILKLTKRGFEKLGIGVTAGGSQKAGGELHRAMMSKYAEKMKSLGHHIVIPVQEGRKEQSDLLVYPREGDGWGKPIAVEIETRAQHPDQVKRNYVKNTRMGHSVVFVVPDETIEKRVRNILSDIDIKIVVLTELYQKETTRQL